MADLKDFNSRLLDLSEMYKVMRDAKRDDEGTTGIICTEEQEVRFYDLVQEIVVLFFEIDATTEGYYEGYEYGNAACAGEEPPVEKPYNGSYREAYDEGYQMGYDDGCGDA